jgi:hypothetical protein
MPFKKKPQKMKTWYKMLIFLCYNLLFLCAEFSLDPSGKLAILIAIYWKISFTRKIIENNVYFLYFFICWRKFLLIIFYWEAEKLQFFYNCIFIFARIVGFMRQVEHIKWKICSKSMGEKIIGNLFGFGRKSGRILNNWKF